MQVSLELKESLHGAKFLCDPQLCSWSVCGENPDAPKSQFLPTLTNFKEWKGRKLQLSTKAEKNCKKRWYRNLRSCKRQRFSLNNKEQGCVCSFSSLPMHAC